MIIWDKKNGYRYEDEQTNKVYGLLEGMCYKGECTSDSIIIWDDEEMCLVNYVQGATFLYEDISELDNTIKQYVDEYKAKQKAKVKAFAKYEFTKAGVKAFLDDASTEFFAEMEKDYDDQNLEQYYINVSCGKRKITVPLGAEEWNALDSWLTECVEEYE